MKGQLPIIIAMILVSSIMLSSLYFITTINTGVFNRTISYENFEWILLDNELDKLTYIALRNASYYADRKFDSLCNETSPSFNLQYCLSEANREMNNRINWILNNWSMLKIIEGYIVEFKQIIGEYYVDKGYGYSRLNYTVIITNRNGELRVFNKKLVAYLYASIRATELDKNLPNNLPPGQLKNIYLRLGKTNFTLTYIYNLTSFIVENDVVMYYYISPREFDSITRKFRGRFLKGELSNLSYSFDTAYYIGRGENIAVSTLSVYIANLDESKLRDLMFALINLHRLVKQSSFTVAISIEGIFVRAILET
ncbi:MAG: hypothetical protein QXX35_03780 [Desulfurococcaceae archaeon]